VNRARLALSLAGFGVAVMAVTKNDRFLLWIAVAFLGTSLSLRIVDSIRRRNRPPEPPTPD
jgi:hypothetical protein